MDLNQKLVSIESSDSVVFRDLFGEDKTFVALVRHLG
jgi:predicted RNA-binding protein